MDTKDDINDEGAILSNVCSQETLTSAPVAAGSVIKLSFLIRMLSAGYTKPPAPHPLDSHLEPMQPTSANPLPAVGTAHKK